MPRGAIANVESAPLYGDKIKVTTNPCCVCGMVHVFILDRHKYEFWQEREHIQKVFPDMSAGDREILISGTCDECFHRLFPPEE